MGLFSSSEKEHRCERCSKVVPKENLNNFDGTLRGMRMAGEKLQLCRKCLFEKLGEYMKSYRYRLIAVYPMKGFNAYQFYGFNMMPRYNFSYQYIENLRLFLPASGIKCGSCSSRSAIVTWCSPEIYEKDPFSPDININDSFAQDYLCDKCFLDRFSQAVRLDNLVFDEFLPPADDDGFCTSFEV